MGAISRLCHFAQRYDSDGLPPLGYASGEDHGIGRTRTRVTHQEACDVLVIYLAPLPRGFLFGLGTLVRFRCRFRNLRFVHIDGVARQGSDTQQRLRTYRTCAGRVLPERDVSSHLIIIGRRKNSQKMLCVERDQMVKTFVPDRPDQALKEVFPLALFEVQPPIAFQIQPQIGQEYPLYSVLPSMMWRTPVMPLTWDMQAVVPFTLEEKRLLDRASKPN